MKKTAIALRGKANAGKTTTIRLVYDRLLERGAEVVSNPPRQKNLRATIVAFDGVKIGFLSIAEMFNGFKKYLDELVGKKCVVIVCSTRSTGETIGIVEGLEPPYHVVWIEKERMAKGKQAIDDDEKADEIIEEIDNATGKVSGRMHP
jgi:hypothetical protein